MRPVIVTVVVLVVARGRWRGYVHSGCRGDPEPPAAGVPLGLAQDRAARISNLRYEATFQVPAAARRAGPRIRHGAIRACGHEPARWRSTSRSLPNRSAPCGESADGPAGRRERAHRHSRPRARRRRKHDRDRVPRRRRGAQPQRRVPVFAVRAGARVAGDALLRSAGSQGALDDLARRCPPGGRPSRTGARSAGRPRPTRRGRRSSSTRRSRSRRISLAFAAGKFSVETAERDGREFRMFHRETDAAKVARNRDAIFDLHASALAWLEDYTGIPYPFGKFDFVAIPSFQFGGMEHPGAIFYNASGLLLDEAATQEPAPRPRQRDLARDRAHVVRRSGDDEVVQRRVDEGGLRQLHGGEDRQPVVPGGEPRAAVSAISTIRRPTTSIARTARIRSGRSWRT